MLSAYHTFKEKKGNWRTTTGDRGRVSYPSHQCGRSYEFTDTGRGEPLGSPLPVSVNQYYFRVDYVAVGVGDGITVTVGCTAE